MKQVRISGAVGLALAVSLAISACGDDSEDSGADSTTSPSATQSPTESSSAPAASDEALKIGYILPETGALAFLGPGTIGAVTIALEDINAAGGVLGKPVEVATGDEGETDGVAANQSADRLLQSDHVHAIVGPLSSTTTTTVISKITGARTVQCSPAATNPIFTDYEDDGYFFRGQPSDELLGPVFAGTMVNDGNVRIGYISRADDGGRNLIKVTSEAVEELGAENAGEGIFFDPTSRNFNAEVETLVAQKPDGILVYAFDEGSALLAKMVEAGIGPENVNIYVHSGLRNGELAAKVAPNNPAVLDGVKGVSPAATSETGFIGRLEKVSPGLTSTLFSGQAYDCTTVIALAAEQAGSTDPTAIRDAMNDVTREGTKCTTFAECKELIAKGEDIDYDGVSGPLDFTDAGEPSVGTYDVFGWDAEGVLSVIDTVRSDELQ